MSDNVLYLADDADVYVSVDNPPVIEDLEAGWDRLLDEVADRSADLTYGTAFPEPDRLERDDAAEDLGAYLGQAYDAADVKWLERVVHEETEYWDVHARHPDLDNGTYLVRVAGLDADRLDVTIGF